MKVLAISLVFLLVAVGYGQAKPEDREGKYGKTEVKVLRRSGKIRIGKPGKSAVTIDFDSIKEVNANGTVVGKSGRPKHSFSTFATQDFQFSDVRQYTYNGLKTKTFNFTASLEGSGAILTVDVFIFLESGEFENGGEATQVTNGTVKFNIEIKNWEYCNGTSNCQKDEIGKFIDFVIEIKSKSMAKRKEGGTKPPKGKKRPKRFDCGDDAIFSASEEVEVDRTMQPMPEGYPKLVITGNKQKFIFRFPKFSDRVLYDPSLTIGDASAVKTSAIVFFGALLAAILAIS